MASLSTGRPKNIMSREDLNEVGKRNTIRLQKMVDKIKSAVDEVFQGDYTHAPHSLKFDTFFGSIKINLTERKNFKQGDK